MSDGHLQIIDPTIKFATSKSLSFVARALFVQLRRSMAARFVAINPSPRRIHPRAPCGVRPRDGKRISTLQLPMQREDASKTTKFHGVRVDCGAPAQLGRCTAFVLQVEEIELEFEQAWRRRYEDFGARVEGISMFLRNSTRDSCLYLPPHSARENLCDFPRVRRRALLFQQRWL